jgi:hypothetical protein
MAERTVATAGTGAIGDGSQVSFTLRRREFKEGVRPRVSVKGLAGSETVDWWVFTGGTWEEVATPGGVQVTFTAGYASDNFNAPGEYGFTKSSTAGSISVLVDNGQ